MTTDLRCPRCGSSRINYYGTSTTMGGGYKGTDARYVCEDCGYVGGLILDVSDDIDEEHKREIEEDLKRIKEEMDEEETNEKEIDKKPIVPQPVPPEIETKIKNILAGESYDFIVYAKRTESRIILLVFLAFSIFMLISGVVTFIIHGTEIIMNLYNGIANSYHLADAIVLTGTIFIAWAGLFLITHIIRGEIGGSAWFIGTSKNLIILPKNKKIESLGQGELERTIAFSSNPKECFIKIGWEKLKDVTVEGSEESGNIEIVTNIMIEDEDNEYPPHPMTIYLCGIENPYQIGSKIRKRIKENHLTTRNLHLFFWDDVPENNAEFINFLKKDMYISWAENAEIKKNEDNKTITVTSADKRNRIILELNETKKKVIFYPLFKKNKKKNTYLSRGKYEYLSLKRKGNKLSVCY